MEPFGACKMMLPPFEPLPPFVSAGRMLPFELVLVGGVAPSPALIVPEMVMWPAFEVIVSVPPSTGEGAAVPLGAVKAPPPVAIDPVITTSPCELIVMG